MTGFEQLWILDEDPALRRHLETYVAVAENRLPAKFRTAATLPAVRDFKSAPEDVLWAELAVLMPDFERARADVRDGGRLGDPVAPNMLDLLGELTNRMLAHCNFCKWECGVDRTGVGKLGTCKLDHGSRVSSFFHHPGEELVYRGRQGSGTIFFTSCNMRCAFCQNGDISTDKENGMEVTAEALAAMAYLLRVEGCHNINWVGGDPTIHLHTIVAAIERLADAPESLTTADLRQALKVKADLLADFADARAEAQYDGRFNAPMLWNSNFFMTDEAMKILMPLMDVWLPDFKFGPGTCAKRLAKTPWYWETVTKNLSAIHDRGEPYTIRHLVMPNHVDCCTRPILEWIAEHLPGAPVNIMDQYHPDTFTDPRSPRYHDKYADLSRRPTRDEIRESYAIAADLGVAFQSVTFERSKLGVRVKRHAGPTSPASKIADGERV